MGSNNCWVVKKVLIKKLDTKLNKSSGRSWGKITVRHKGGALKKRYKLLDYGRFFWNSKGYIASLEFDTIRSTLVALVYYPILQLAAYIPVPEGLKPGDTIESGYSTPLQLGNSLFLKNIPLQEKIHNIESKPGCGGVYCRTAGSWAKTISKGEHGVTVVFKNGVKKVLSGTCMATIGSVSVMRSKQLFFRTAGQRRRQGVRPAVRGVVMNPVDHPHGGGNGKKSGKRISMSPWGKLGKGVKTVKVKNNVTR